VLASTGELKVIVESFRDWGRACWCAPGNANTCGKRFDWELGDLPRGYDHKYTTRTAAYNLKPTDLQAAIGLSQLDKLDRFTAERRRNWDFLRQAAAHLGEFFEAARAHATERAVVVRLSARRAGGGTLHARRAGPRARGAARPDPYALRRQSPAAARVPLHPAPRRRRPRADGAPAARRVLGRRLSGPQRRAAPPYLASVLDAECKRLAAGALAADGAERRAEARDLHPGVQRGDDAAKVLDRIPPAIREEVGEIFVIDNNSPDNTYLIAVGLSQSENDYKLSVFRNKKTTATAGARRSPTSTRSSRATTSWRCCTATRSTRRSTWCRCSSPSEAAIA